MLIYHVQTANLRLITLNFLLIAFCVVSAWGGPDTKQARGSRELMLWYTRPAKSWMTEALPIGNGRLGGMIFGGTDSERIQFNEISLWTGSEVNTDDHSKEGAYQAFGDVLITIPGHDTASSYRRTLDI